MRYRIALYAMGLALLFALQPLSAQSTDATDQEAEKARVLGNLKLAFPQLVEMDVVMGEIGPSAFDGLNQGSFTVNGQPQKFFLSTHDQQLYLISSEPVDASRSLAEIDAEIGRRQAAEDAAAAALHERLAAAIDGRPSRGNPSAPVTIVEFGDFQCPYCARSVPTVEEILAKYPDQVRFVFLNFYLDFHPWARPAAIAAHCAAQQEPAAFWILVDRYFAHQAEIESDNVAAKTREYLADTGIDLAAWASCAEDSESPEYQVASAVVAADRALGVELGVTGTPGFFVNGHFISGAQPVEAFEAAIARARPYSVP